jgi:GMP synthase-like glutamine amidotransferase
MHPTYKIAILDMNAGQPNEGMRCIKMLVQQFLDKDDVQGEYQIFDVRVDHKLPELEDFDIYISSGGPDSPKPIGEKWEKKYFRFLDELYDHNLLEERKKYLFLICHSFQLAIFHWKLAKVKKRKSTAFGIMPVHKTKKGKSEPFLEGLNNPFYAVDSRDYQVVKPKKKRLKSLGCSILCKEKKRPHVPLERAVMAIRFSDEIFGVQFHPEADSEGMLRYFMRADKKSHIIKHHGKKKYLDMIEHLDDDDKILKTNRTIIPRFLQQAADSLDRLKPISV